MHENKIVRRNHLQDIQLAKPQKRSFANISNNVLL